MLIIPLDMQKCTRSAPKPVRFLDIPNELQMLCSQKDLPIRYSLDIHLIFISMLPKDVGYQRSSYANVGQDSN